MDDDEFKQEYRAFRADLRALHLDRNAYFEKLALLDAGTVALAINAVLGPLHGQAKHGMLLGSGLSVLVLAMLVLFGRNLAANQNARHHLAITFGFALDEAKTGIEKTSRLMIFAERSGIALTAIGMVLLVINVWLLLW